MVGPDGEYAFAPETVTVALGEAVTWTWTWAWPSSSYDIAVPDRPGGSDWSGTAGGAAETYAEGHGHSHAFETPGTYAYYRSPHQGLGMRAEVVVE